MSWKRIGLFPRGHRCRRPRFFRALEDVYAVRFEDRAWGELRALDGAIVLGGSEERVSEIQARGIPCLVAPDRKEGRSLSHHDGVPGSVDLSASSLLDPKLHARRLADASVRHAEPVLTEDLGTVLASHEGVPLWVARRSNGLRTDHVAISPLDPPDGLPLRAQLRQGRFLSLLPLIHLLREVTADRGWRAPPPRAVILIDDPNLRRPSYGFVNYARLKDDARRAGYHASLAMVPLDAGVFRADVADLFRGAPDALSLLIHGNDHLRHELSLTSELRATALLAQALRRAWAFERRSGISVSPVMAAPHERCSVTAMRTMFRLGFEGVSLDWRYPWRHRAGTSRLLGGFGQAEMLAGGLPVFVRDHLSYPKEDLVFRAFLDQPILLYCHHTDLREGMEPLAEAATEINRFGAVEWLSPSSIARSNFRFRRDGSTLVIRMASRRISIDVPEGVDALQVETDPVESGVTNACLRLNGSRHPAVCSREGWRSAPIEVAPGETSTVILEPTDGVDPHAIPAPDVGIWPRVRRRLSEGRDRVQPAAHRLSRSTRRR